MSAHIGMIARYGTCLCCCCCGCRICWWRAKSCPMFSMCCSWKMQGRNTIRSYFASSESPVFTTRQKEVQRSVQLFLVLVKFPSSFCNFVCVFLFPFFLSKLWLCFDSAKRAVRLLKTSMCPLLPTRFWLCSDSAKRAWQYAAIIKSLSTPNPRKR